MSTRFTGNNGECFYCGKECIATKDHFYPKIKRRSVKDKVLIIVYSCIDCNKEKADMLPYDFLEFARENKNEKYVENVQFCIDAYNAMSRNYARGEKEYLDRVKGLGKRIGRSHYELKERIKGNLRFA